MPGSVFRRTSLSRSRSRAFSSPPPAREPGYGKHTAMIIGALAVVLVPVVAFSVPQKLLASLTRTQQWEASEKAQGKDPSLFHRVFNLFVPRDPTAGPVDTYNPPPSANRRGVYFTASSVARDAFFQQTVDDLLKAGGTSIVIDVKGTSVFFPSSAPIANELGQMSVQYDLPKIVEAMHQKGIYVIARYVSLKDETFSKKVPEAQLRNSKTGKTFDSIWVDGANALTLEYNKQIITDVAKAGVDEINLDYIRYPTEYDQKLIDLTGAEKAQHVLQFIQMARATINATNPKVKLGLSTYAIMGWSFNANLEAIGQDFTLFAPYVDIISPMAYPQTFPKGQFYTAGKDEGSRMYFLVKKTLTGYADRLGPEESKKLRPWIQGYSVTDQDMHDQMQAVYDAGFCGFQVWNAGNNYVHTFAALKNGLPVPVHCADAFVEAAAGSGTEVSSQ